MVESSVKLTRPGRDKKPEFATPAKKIKIPKELKGTESDGSSI